MRVIIFGLMLISFLSPKSNLIDSDIISPKIDRNVIIKVPIGSTGKLARVTVERKSIRLVRKLSSRHPLYLWGGYALWSVLGLGNFEGKDIDVVLDDSSYYVFENSSIQVNQELISMIRKTYAPIPVDVSHHCLFSTGLWDWLLASHRLGPLLGPDPMSPVPYSVNRIWIKLTLLGDGSIRVSFEPILEEREGRPQLYFDDLAQGVLRYMPFEYSASFKKEIAERGLLMIQRYGLRPTSETETFLRQILGDRRVNSAFRIRQQRFGLQGESVELFL